MGKTWPLFLQIKHGTQNSSKSFLNYKIIFWNMSGVPFRCVMILQKFNFHLGVNEMLNKWRFSFKKIVLVLKLTQYLTNDFLKYEWGCLVDGQFWFRLFNFHRIGVNQMIKNLLFSTKQLVTITPLSFYTAGKTTFEIWFRVLSRCTIRLYI